MIAKLVCPWCRSEISRNAGSTCTTCERPLFDEGGDRLREIDLVYEQVVADELDNRRRFLVRGTPIAALVSLGGPLIHGALAFVFSLPLFMLVHAIALRLYLVREPRRLLGRRRRFFTRHVARGVFVILTAIGYSLTTVPAAGALAGAITFAGVTWLTQEYLMWSLRQERDREPTALWEKLAIVALVFIFIGILAIAATFGWVAAKLLG